MADGPLEEGESGLSKENGLSQGQIRTGLWSSHSDQTGDVHHPAASLRFEVENSLSL